MKFSSKSSLFNNPIASITLNHPYPNHETTDIKWLQGQTKTTPQRPATARASARATTLRVLMSLTARTNCHDNPVGAPTSDTGGDDEDPIIQGG